MNLLKTYKLADLFNNLVTPVNDYTLHKNEVFHEVFLFEFRNLVVTGVLLKEFDHETAIYAMYYHIMHLQCYSDLCLFKDTSTNV